MHVMVYLMDNITEDLTATAETPASAPTPETPDVPVAYYYKHPGPMDLTTPPGWEFSDEIANDDDAPLFVHVATEPVTTEWAAYYGPRRGKNDPKPVTTENPAALPVSSPDQPEAPAAPSEPTPSPSGEAEVPPAASVDAIWSEASAIPLDQAISATPATPVEAATESTAGLVPVIDQGLSDALAAGADAAITALFGDAHPSEQEQTALEEIVATDVAADVATEPVTITDNQASLLEARAALLVAAHNSLNEPEILTDSEYRQAIEHAATLAVVQATAEAPNQHPLAAYDPSFLLATGLIAGQDLSTPDEAVTA
jgi:hypothetical protein